jgi:hypothetical protein
MKQSAHVLSIKLNFGCARFMGVGLYAPIFFAKSKKGFPLQSLTQKKRETVKNKTARKTRAVRLLILLEMSFAFYTFHFNHFSQLHT